MKKEALLGINYFYFMNSRKTLPILMCLTILVICAFQVYWVSDNYQRERKSLQLKTSVAFSETVRALQTKNLRIPGLSSSPVRNSKQVIIRQDLRGSTSAGGGEAFVHPAFCAAREPLNITLGQWQQR